MVYAVNSPRLQVTPDTGNFLEDMYEQMELPAPKAALVQAKTFYGGLWCTPDIDYERVVRVLRQHG